MKNITVITLVALLIACEMPQNKNQASNDSKGQLVKINPQIEKKLRIDLEDYLIAFNGGDPDKAINYVYPDMFVYMKNKYPDEYDINKVKDEMREMIQNMKSEMKEEGITYSFEIGEILNTVEYKGTLFYVVKTSLVAKKGLDSHSFGGKIIGVTRDNGINWKFLQLDDPELVKPVLMIQYPSNIVNEVLK